MRKKPIITIDGPAGAGKSTISKILAERLAYVYLDTGALYRAMAYRLASHGIDEANDSAINLIRRIHVTLENSDGRLRVFADGEDVTEKIRTEEIGLFASRISAIPMVREALLAVQRDVAMAGGVVAEGRDMGTVVFPDAEVKFFLDASVAERAGRRHSELLEKGESVRLADVENRLVLRDRQDRERSVAPLTVPPGAVVIDSTDKGISQVAEIMMRIIEDIRSSGSCKK